MRWYGKGSSVVERGGVVGSSVRERLLWYLHSCLYCHAACAIY